MPKEIQSLKRAEPNKKDWKVLRASIIVMDIIRLITVMVTTQDITIQVITTTGGNSWKSQNKKRIRFCVTVFEAETKFI